MSVCIANAGDVHLLQYSAAQYTPQATRDLFTVLHGAQFTAYLLSYGVMPADEAYSNRSTYAVPETPLTPAQVMERLSRLEHNTVSNGGNACLPPCALHSLAQVRTALVGLALREAGFVRVHRCKIVCESLPGRDGTGVYLVLPWESHRHALSTGDVLRTATVRGTVEDAVAQARVFEQQICEDFVRRGHMEAWELSVVAAA